MSGEVARGQSEEAGLRGGLDEEPPVPSSVLALLATLREHVLLLVFAPLLAGSLALGFSYLIKPTYTARTTLLPPQPASMAGQAALAPLGALAGLAGAGVRAPADLYVSLMQSERIRNQIVDSFDLMAAYQSKLRSDARVALDQHVRIAVGKKDGLISIDVDDTDPKRSADIANAHVDALRKLNAEIAITEAQQRRIFFENEVKVTRARLDKAQQELQATGFSESTLRSEPRSAAETYARLRAEVTAAEVRVQTLRRTFTDNAPELGSQLAALSAMRQQLSRLEVDQTPARGADYLNKYREFKYQETLHELFLKQFELARLDEGKEGGLFQVVDRASTPERKSKPKRAYIALAGTAAGLMLALLVIWMQRSWAQIRSDPLNADNLRRLSGRSSS